MPAKSKAQQRYFGYLLSNKDEREKEGVSRKVAREFAGTKHKGLPEKVKEGIDEGIGKALKKGLERDKKARQKKKEKEGRAVPYGMLAQEYIPEDAPTMSTGSTGDAAGLSGEADAQGPVAGLDQPLGGTQKQPRGKGCKKGRRYCTKKSKDGVNFVDSRVKGVKEGFKGQYKDKSKLSQSSQRKSLGRGASIKDGAKKSGYESPKEHRATSKKLAKYQAKGTYNAHLGEENIDEKYGSWKGDVKARDKSYKKKGGRKKTWARGGNEKLSDVNKSAEKKSMQSVGGFRGAHGANRKSKSSQVPAAIEYRRKSPADKPRTTDHESVKKIGRFVSLKKKVSEGRQPDDGSSKGNPRYLPFHVKNELENIEFIFYGQSPAQVKIQLRKIYRPERLNNFKVKRVYPNDVLKFYWNKRQDAMRANG